MWDYFGEHPDAGATFGRAMREVTAIDLAALVLPDPWPRRGVTATFQEGSARFSRRSSSVASGRGAFCWRSPRCWLRLQASWNSCGVADRVERRAGDLFGELEARADVYVLKWILHDWSDDACRDILARVRATMPSGSKVVAIDAHRDVGLGRTP